MASKKPTKAKVAPRTSLTRALHDENRRAAVTSLGLDAAALDRVPDPLELAPELRAALGGGGLDFLPEARAALELLERELAWWRAALARIDRQGWITTELHDTAEELRSATPLMKRAIVTLRVARTIRPGTTPRDVLLAMLRDAAKRLVSLGGKDDDAIPTVHVILRHLGETFPDLAAQVRPHAQDLAAVLIAWSAFIKRKGKPRDVGHFKLFAKTWKAATGETVTPGTLQTAISNRSSRQ
jgi:hypothetical protein